MRSKMTPDRKIKMIQLLYSTEKSISLSEIAKNLGVSQGTISRWRKYEVMEIYLASLRSKTNKPGGLTNEQLMEKYGINIFQLQRILSDAPNYFMNIEGDELL